MSQLSQLGGTYLSTNTSRDLVVENGFVTWCFSIRRDSMVPRLRSLSRGMKRKLMEMSLSNGTA